MTTLTPTKPAAAPAAGRCEFFTPAEKAARRKFYKTKAHARLCRLADVLSATVSLIDLVREDDDRRPAELESVYGECADHLRYDLRTLRGMLRTWEGLVESQVIGGEPDHALFAAIAR